MALILSRNVGESVLIGEDILVTLVAIQGRQARLAIDAPRDVKILRDELVEDGRSEPGPAGALEP